MVRRPYMLNGNVRVEINLSCRVRLADGNDLLRTRLPGVPGLKDNIKLLQRSALGLNKEKVDDYKLEAVPEDEKGVAKSC